MTTVTVYALPGGTLCGFEAAGHTGAGRVKGYDLVCCAVSALTQTGVNALERVAGVTPKVTVRDGYLRCILPAGVSGAAMERAQIVLGTILEGLSDVSKVYPKLLRIQHVEWRQSDAYDESTALRA